MLLVAAVAGPGLVARRVAARASRSLGTSVHVGWLRWNPLSTRWTLDHLRIAADRGPAALVARRVSARIHLWDVLRGSYRVRALVPDGPRLRPRATAAGRQPPLSRISAAASTYAPNTTKRETARAPSGGSPAAPVGGTWPSVPRASRVSGYAAPSCRASTSTSAAGRSRSARSASAGRRCGCAGGARS